MRNFLLGSGFLCCVVIGAVWAASLRWAFCYVGEFGSVAVAHGQVITNTASGRDVDQGVKDSLFGTQRGWIIRDQSVHFDHRWRASTGLVLPRIQESNPGGTGLMILRSVDIPLWIPFVLMAIPSGVFFSRRTENADRVGCRSCGYCLHGNTSGRCSECGAPIGNESMEARQSDPSAAGEE